MANISDVYEIEFLTQSEQMAKALFAYCQKLEQSPVEYNLTSEAELDGLTINGGYACGRWVYSSNIEGYFVNRASWCDDDAEAEFTAVRDLLKAGETIEIGWSEDEPGCEVFADGMATISWHDDHIVASIDYVDHDRPDCDMVATDDGWYCEDHDQDQAEQARYCEAVAE